MFSQYRETRDSKMVVLLNKSVSVLVHETFSLPRDALSKVLKKSTYTDIRLICFVRGKIYLTARRERQIYETEER